jgi:hypothetical protein
MLFLHMRTIIGNTQVEITMQMCRNTSIGDILIDKHLHAIVLAISQKFYKVTMTDRR